MKQNLRELMICELCGKEVPYLKPIIIEGSILKVCSVCEKFGTGAPPKPSPSLESSSTGEYRSTHGVSAGTPSPEDVVHRRLEFRARRMKSKDIYEQSGPKELVEDYHKRIQQARSQLGLNQEQLGQKINERKSIISKLENKSLKPDDKLVRKLEKALEIKLMEVVE
jgi:putative transcription factor